MSMIRRVLNPAWYHGHRARPPFFEGWYYKLVDPSGRHKLAIIPGIFRGHAHQDSHAFIQILDGVTSASHYASYPTTAFWAKPGAFDVRIAGSRFDLQQFELDIDQSEVKISGEIRLGPLTPWPVSLLSPGIMGWYAWIPMMECFHGVLSMDHELAGTLHYNGVEIDLTGGRGYLEKDWGRAFPRGYIWFQSNHFGQPGTSLTASIAIIPWIRRPFPGFIIGLLHDGTLYRFATYNGARISHLTIDDDLVQWTVRRRELTLEMVARRAHGGILQAPTLDGMDRRIAESMNSQVEIRLTRKGVVIFSDTGAHAGLEVAGDLDRLLALQRNRSGS